MTDAPPLAPADTTPVERPSLMPLAVLILGAAIIGVGPILVRLSDAGPTATGAWRLIFALPLLTLMALRHGDAGPLGRPPRLALIAGVMFALDVSFWHYGIALTSVVNATVLANLTPIVVVIFSWFAFGQRPRLAFVGALALAISGSAMMALAKGGAGQQNLLGDALSVGSALWYGLYFLAVTAARRNTGAARVMFWSTLAGAPLLMLGALAFGERLTPLTMTGWLACAGLGLMHVTGQGAIAWALGRLPTATASVVVLVQPVVAGLLGWALFQESLTPLQALGGAVALAGVAAAQIAGVRAPRVATQAAP